MSEPRRWRFDAERFGSDLRRMRTAMGLSQTEVADRLDVNRRTIAAWEGQAVTPSVQTLCDVCEVLGLDPREYLARL